MTLANAFNTAPPILRNTFAVDPNFRVGYAQNWQVSVQRDLPYGLQITAAYLGTKGSHLYQESLPNTYPSGAANPCETCPVGFAYLTSNGSSKRHGFDVQLRRRLHRGFTATVQYTLAKATDDASFAGPGQPGELIAQNWLDLRAERGPSNFDERHKIGFQMQYTSGMGLRGGSLLSSQLGSLFREWTITTQVAVGSSLPLSPTYGVPVRGTGFIGPIRPDFTGANVDDAPAGLFLNPAAYRAPATGQWGNARRNSITGPSQFSFNASLTRTLRVNDRINADLRLDAMNVLNHVTFPNWNTNITSTHFGLPDRANPMRKIQTSLRLRF